MLKIGDRAIDFSLPGTDGRIYTLSSFVIAKAIAIIFTCNHCPYAQSYQDRIIAIQKEYEQKGLRIVAINPNDAENYPEDSFDAMVERAKERKYNFPYLRDEMQEATEAYGAEVTPDVFLFDQKKILRYRGRIDDNWRDPSKVRSQDFKNAIDAVLSGKEPPVKEARAVGCSIKWKEPD